MPRFTPFRSTLDISKIGAATKTQSDHRYDALRNLGNHSDSDTDVEDWEDDKTAQPRRKKSTRIWKRIKAYRWMIDTALLLVIIGLLVERIPKSLKGHRYEFAGDISGFAPECRSAQLPLTITALTPSSLPEARQLQDGSHLHARKRIRLLEHGDAASVARHRPGRSRLRRSQRPREVLEPSASHPRLRVSNGVHDVDDAPAALLVHDTRGVQHASAFGRAGVREQN